MMPLISHSSLQEIVERNIKASRVCDPIIVDDHLTPTSKVESDSGEGHLGRRPDLRRRGWRMCWFGIEDQTCSTRNRIANTRFFVLFLCFISYSSLECYWLDRVHHSQIFFYLCYTATHLNGSFFGFFFLQVYYIRFGYVSGTVERITTAIPLFGSPCRRRSDDMYVR